MVDLAQTSSWFREKEGRLSWHKIAQRDPDVLIQKMRENNLRERRHSSFCYTSLWSCVAPCFTFRNIPSGTKNQTSPTPQNCVTCLVSGLQTICFGWFPAYFSCLRRLRHHRTPASPRQPEPPMNTARAYDATTTKGSSLPHRHRRRRHYQPQQQTQPQPQQPQQQQQEQRSEQRNEQQQQQQQQSSTRVRVAFW